MHTNKPNGRIFSLFSKTQPALKVDAQDQLRDLREVTCLVDRVNDRSIFFAVTDSSYRPVFSECLFRSYGWKFLWIVCPARFWSTMQQGDAPTSDLLWPTEFLRSRSPSFRLTTSITSVLTLMLVSLHVERDQFAFGAAVENINRLRSCLLISCASYRLVAFIARSKRHSLLLWGPSHARSGRIHKNI